MGSGWRIQKLSSLFLFVGYYKGLLGTSFQNYCAYTELSNALTSRVPEERKNSLISPVTVEEIQVALKSIKEDKAPGPDGYNSSFYHQKWDVVGPDFVSAIKQFFNSGFLLKEWN